MFHEESTLKYLLTVLLPAGLALLALARRPLEVLTVAAIVTAPFAFVASPKGIAVSPVQLFVVGGLLVALVSERPGRGRWLGRATTVACVLLLVPVFAGASPSHYLLLIAFVIAIGWLAYTVARERPHAIALSLAASGALQGLLAIWEYRSGHTLNLYQGSGASTAGPDYFFNSGHAVRSSGALPDPIALGQVLALTIPVSLALCACERRVWLRTLLAAGTLASFLGLVLSYSRMSWVGALAGIVLALTLLPPGRRLWAALATAGTLAVMVALALSIGGRPLQLRIQSVLHPTASGVSTAQGDRLRKRIWVAALATAEAHPLSGTGFGNLIAELDQRGVSEQADAHAHDTYLQFLAEGGLLGGTALLLWLAAAGADLLAALRAHRALAAGAAGALLATLIAWTTDVEVRYLQVSAMVAVLFGLIAALAPPRET